MSDRTESAYLTFLASQERELCAAISRDVAAEIPFLGKAGAAEATTWVEGVVAGVIRVLAGEAETGELVAHFVDLAGRGAAAEEVVRAVTVCRRHGLRVSLRALPEVSGAAEGTLRLSACFDAAAEGIGRHYAKVAEARCRDGAARFRSLVSAIGNVIVIVDEDGRISDWNGEAERVYGCPREEALGKDYFETFLPPEVHAAIRADMRKVLAGEPSRSYENPVLSRDGAIRIIEWNVDRVVDGEGRPVAIVGSGYDVTEHRQIRDRLERSRAEVQAILDNAPIVVFVKDLEGRFTFVNRQFDELFNFDRGWAVGKFDADFLPPEAVKQNRDNDLEALAAGRPLSSEETIPGKDGIHIYMVSKFPIFDEGGVPYAVCGIALDITTHKRAEEERAELAQKIIDAQHAALRALSTPLLPIASGVVLMPLVGAIDAGRAALVLETLLDGVGTHRAEVAILDITGLKDIDAEVASGLVQAAQAAALLGAEVVLTGVRPAAARALIELGVDMRGIKTLSSLQQGVTHAIMRSRGRALSR
ncbi:PAS domain-containing protein [Polyangium jinanense]|uniref:PAS domain-containing protein n=1 Tax=Polyangium jinanense TaxID=2829994 RepID=A0A9X4AXJ3_9BACT|nr:PAS domain-containing protein [Polyangium jinanense]MDC3959864.1 PAS domain-containing protein [Polyangium jinanense]MDC3986315.1 PAS domain-containing protein [Polyangium jinanense]